MTKQRSFFAIAGVLAICTTASARLPRLSPHPDLSGSWSVASTEGLGYSPFGARFTVRQDASTITIQSDRETVTYRLDDSENARTTQTATGATWRRVSRARFVQHALLVTTRIEAGPTGQWEDLFIVSLDRPGEVTVVTSNTVKSLESAMSTRLFKYTKVQ